MTQMYECLCFQTSEMKGMGSNTLKEVEFSRLPLRLSISACLRTRM